MPAMKHVDELSYEQARDELAEVVRALEAGTATLEDSLLLWERGEALAAACQAFLDGARKRLDAVTGQSASESSPGPAGGGSEPEPAAEPAPEPAASEPEFEPAPAPAASTGEPVSSGPAPEAEAEAKKPASRTKAAPRGRTQKTAAPAAEPADTALPGGEKDA